MNAVAPGAIKTPMVDAGLKQLGVSAEDHAQMISLFGRLGELREVAKASLWLCSDASSFVAGETLAVDAGY